MYLEKENRNDIMTYKQTFLLDDLENGHLVFHGQTFFHFFSGNSYFCCILRGILLTFLVQKYTPDILAD